MRRIYKYALKITDVQNVEIPAGFQPLTVALQDGWPCLWCVVFPEAAPVTVTIRCRGTGHPISPERNLDKYLGTVVMMGDSLVWHFFQDPQS